MNRSIASATVLTLISCVSPALPGSGAPGGVQPNNESAPGTEPGAVFASRVPVLPQTYPAPDGETIYSLDQQSRPVAIAVASGEILWRARDSVAVHLGAWEDWVLALRVAGPAETVVVWLERSTGELSSVSERLPLPNWVSLVEVPGKRFAAWLEPSSDGSSVELVWRAESFYAGGAHPTEDVLAASRKNASGVLRLSSDGSVASPDAPMVEGRASEESEASARGPQWTEFYWQTRDLETGRGTITLERVVQGGTGVAGVELRARGGEIRDGSRMLAAGDEVVLLWPPRGDRLVARVRRTARQSPAEEFAVVFRTSDLQRLGEVRLPRSLAVTALGDRLVALVEEQPTSSGAVGPTSVPRYLVAWDIATSEQLWRAETVPRQMPMAAPMAPP